MKTLKVNGKYSYGDVIVDDKTYHILKNKSLNSKPNGYIYFSIVDQGKTKNIYIHRFVANPDAKQDVDHINGDKLDNRLDNLRVCDRSHNMANRSKKERGVYKVGNSWQAKIMKDYSSIHIGCFDNKNDALKAYREKAKELFGEYAS